MPNHFSHHNTTNNRSWSRRRQLPNWTPERGTDLRSRGISKWQLQKNYTRIGRDVWIPNERVPELCIIGRARAQFLARPDLPITGFAALAFYGLQVLTEGQEVAVVVHDKKGKHTLKADETSTMCRRESVPRCETQRPDPLHPELACVEPAESLISALKSVRKGRAQWFVHRIDSRPLEDIRAIQLVDAVRRLFPHQHFLDKVFRRSSRRIDRAWLRMIFDASDPGADSPLETTMRLVATGVKFDGKVVTWESQVPLYEHQGPADVMQKRDENLTRGRERGREQGGEYRGEQGGEQCGLKVEDQFVPWLTVADLYCPELGIVLFYDGAHHREKAQHHRDTRIDAILQHNGFRVLRVTELLLRDPDGLRATIVALAGSS